ncbi:methylated-DNA--[protein]-cysteine S-methyltransferase [Flavobacterium sp. 20NA77.7]|jgi:methylated-DNA-[protein]-cysteine S-methyltransferase|uniref:Methylated-DNA--protein-cysteine methyltransferase n=1 Tax=Flavobacterium nakdongensis TaxID=3073563 RepID=A0ABY9R999_9FLAO|nr:methylated-DNA--[protein]-cysteine S-methyltransferase [Flavobacterium sp. 20NA77.7]WMW77810.1 methylated-DNA--[protein]-cysteine S-methyltransferase [Flavobacterium sp. 20NA77.7]
MEKALLQTPLGNLLIEGDENGLTSLSIISDEIKITHTSQKTLEDAIIQLQEYFEGKRKQFTIRLNPQGTNFQKKVWQKLLEIPFGTTISYQQLSNQLGDSKAIRAVANANSKNPLWIIIPCHRVIGSDGSLTGYAGGLWRKKWLLEHENPSLQQRLF